jgi:hypothetical protein
MSILLKISLMCISIPIMSSCLPLTTLTGGVLGLGDSMNKNHRMDEMEKRIVQLELVVLVKKYRPDPRYIPSYVGMETFKTGIYDK